MAENKIETPESEELEKKTDTEVDNIETPETEEPKYKTDAELDQEAYNYVTKTFGAIPEKTEYSIPEPQKSDYIANQEFISKYFPSISKEEEDKRVRKARNIERAINFTRAGLALANAFAVAGGATSQKIEPVQFPDLRKYRMEEQSKRAAAAQAERAGVDNYLTSYRTWMQGKRSHDTDIMKDRQQWLRTFQNYRKQIGSEQDRQKALDEKKREHDERLEDKKEQDAKSNALRARAIDVQAGREARLASGTETTTTETDETTGAVTTKSTTTRPGNNKGNTGKKKTKKPGKVGVAKRKK